jgi:hypothetical protein
MSLPRSRQRKPRTLQKTSETTVFSLARILSCVSTRQTPISDRPRKYRHCASCPCLADRSLSRDIVSDTSCTVFHVSFVVLRVSFVNSSIFLLIESQKRIKKLGLRFSRDSPL